MPRALARFDPELAWTLDYEDAPEPEDADPRLDFSGGALLVPVERWNEQAALEPNLAPCRAAAPFAAAMDTPPTSPVSALAPSSGDDDERLTSGVSVARVVARAATTALAALASPRSHDGNGRAAGVCHRLTDHPLAILRLGLALQSAGFLALVAIH